MENTTSQSETRMQTSKKMEQRIKRPVGPSRLSKGQEKSSKSRREQQ
jgi:hypothetical protein